MEKKLTISEVLAQFARYYQRNPSWGSLHIVLADGNTDIGNVEFCRKWAVDHNDQEGAILAEILIEMTESQRNRLSYKVYDHLKREKTS